MHFYSLSEADFDINTDVIKEATWQYTKIFYILFHWLKVCSAAKFPVLTCSGQKLKLIDISPGCVCSEEPRSSGIDY